MAFAEAKPFTAASGGTRALVGRMPLPATGHGICMWPRKGTRELEAQGGPGRLSTQTPKAAEDPRAWPGKRTAQPADLATGGAGKIGTPDGSTLPRSWEVRNGILGTLCCMYGLKSGMVRAWGFRNSGAQQE